MARSRSRCQRAPPRAIKMATGHRMITIIGWLRRLAQDQQGTVAVLVGLSLTMLVGFVGLGVEVGLWYEVRRSMQVSSSTAAIAAANALRTWGTLPSGGTAAK